METKINPQAIAAGSIGSNELATDAKTAGMYITVIGGVLTIVAPERMELPNFSIGRYIRRRNGYSNKNEVDEWTREAAHKTKTGLSISRKISTIANDRPNYLLTYGYVNSFNYDKRAYYKLYANNTPLTPLILVKKFIKDNCIKWGQRKIDLSGGDYIGRHLKFAIVFENFKILPFTIFIGNRYNEDNVVSEGLNAWLSK